MIKSVVYKIFGSKNDRELKKMTPVVRRINELEPTLTILPDLQLQQKTVEFRERIANGEPLDDVLPEAFAVVREASRRVLEMRHFDTQLIGGMILHSGRIAEMKTGEGKTLVATLPAYLNALTGEGVHVVTVNDYLARRDAEWMGRIYGFLGMSVGCVLHGLEHAERQAAYNADISYGQNNEFGFDYLRDNMKVELGEKVQRVHNFAIVDEVDSILVDEARTPLIISGPSDDPTDKYKIADQVVSNLRETEHYTIDLKGRNAMLTDQGVMLIEEMIKVTNLYDPQNIQFVHHINQSLKARAIFKRDVDYVVKDKQILIVDEFTGRTMPGRRWSDGLHQAIEAKERVPIARENQTLATITFQNYFRMYKKLAGMTGTADTEAVEFKKIYNLDVVIAPTNKKMIRRDYADVVFVSERAKFKAVCDEIEERTAKGQPLLVGTASIAKSELLSEMLSERGVKHHVLNAKQHEREAEIVAQAGRYGAVTISTNMAGRGTDILLGGNPEFLAAGTAGTKDPSNPEYQSQLEIYKQQCAEEKSRVVEAGGLHIIGTERHESRRIDNQLRGRSGRQGDPGSSRFFVSLEDDLMKRFGGDMMKSIMSRMGMKEEDAIEGLVVARAIENAQKKIEAYHFEIRKHLLDYDNVLNKQREIIYSQRERVLRADGIENDIRDMIGDVVEDLVLSRVIPNEPPARWDVAAMLNDFMRHFAIEFPAAEWIQRAESAGSEFAQELFDTLKELALARYEERKQNFGAEISGKLERHLYLTAVDHFWKEHLTNIDYLKEGIGLRTYGQKNPLYEYQREAFELFSTMIISTKTAMLHQLFTVQLLSPEQVAELEEREREMQRQQEALARTIHQDVVEGASAPEQPQAEGAVARNAQAKKQQETAQERARQDAARKKGRDARDARKRSR